jgi:hypothetical protein
MNKYKSLTIDICDFSHIEQYLRKICVNIYYLLEIYCDVYKIEDREEYIINILHNGNIYSAGQVRKCDVKQLPLVGNIREMMTFIYMFGLNGSKIIMSLMLDENFYAIVKDYIHERRILERYDRLKKSLGISSKYEIIKFINNDIFVKDYKGIEFITSAGNSLPCLFASLVKYGINSISKNTDFPFNVPARKKNTNDTIQQYDNNDIYPKLSEREIAWFEENNVCENMIPWKSGREYYKMNENSYYYTAANVYNQKTLSGFSGTSDLVLDVMSLFNEYEVYISLHSCLLWMCCGNVKDHSIYEILVGIMPYGIDYTINIDAEEYCISKGLIIENYYTN